MTATTRHPAATLRAIAATAFLHLILLCSVQIGAVTYSPSARADETADQAKQIVEKTDRIRFPRESFQVDVTINSTEADGHTEQRKYRILSRGTEDTLVMPTVSQPIRLPLAQRLTGQVANGDLARANFAGDYNAKMLRKDNIDNQWYWVLELTAVDRGVTYDRVVYWVNQADNRPYKAEFYTRSNKLMKTCFYQNFATMQGEQRPTRLLMIDNLNQDNKSTLDYSDMVLKNLPEKVFTKDYLKKLQ